MYAHAVQVQRDYEELPAEAVPQLRDSLLQLLLRFGRGAPAVRTQLCLAMAALAAHLPAAQWSEGGVLRWLMERFNGQDPAVAMSCMLELLTVLPQVCRVSRLDGSDWQASCHMTEVAVT
jgi:transportin-3